MWSCLLQLVQNLELALPYHPLPRPYDILTSYTFSKKLKSSNVGAGTMLFSSLATSKYTLLMDD